MLVVGREYWRLMWCPGGECTRVEDINVEIENCNITCYEVNPESPSYWKIRRNRVI